MLRRGERQGTVRVRAVAAAARGGWVGLGRSVPRAVPRLQFEGLQFKWRGCGAQVGERN